jgi:hypothetical protein
MNDKRKFEDAQKDWFKSIAGGATNEIGNMFLGGRDMLNGDYLYGATRMLPELFKNVAEAAYIDKHGYVDKNGTKWPVQPSVADILKKVVGIDPTNESQYEEAVRIKGGLLAQRQERQQNISRHLLMAQAGQADMNYWLAQAIQFTHDHPGLGGPLAGFGESLRRRAVSAAIAKEGSYPIGTRPQDWALKANLGFVQPQE